MDGDFEEVCGYLQGKLIKLRRLPEDSLYEIIDLVKIKGGGVMEGITLVTIGELLQQGFAHFFPDVIIGDLFLPGY